MNAIALPEAPDREADLCVEAIIDAILPHTERLSRIDRHQAAIAAWGVMGAMVELMARAKAQRDTAALRQHNAEMTQHANHLTAANADLLHAQVALRKAHQQAEERVQYWRAQFAIEAQRALKLELANRRPWWAWWSR